MSLDPDVSRAIWGGIIDRCREMGAVRHLEADGAGGREASRVLVLVVLALCVLGGLAWMVGR